MNWQKMETTFIRSQQPSVITQNPLATVLSAIWLVMVSGMHLHEDPQIPNFRQRNRGLRIVKGMTFAIEPMITAGRPDVEWLDDDWTVVTEDGSLAAHYENTILITDGEPEILTLAE